MDALLVDFITNFDIDMMDATVAYCIVLYCNHRNERIASCGSLTPCIHWGQLRRTCGAIIFPRSLLPLLTRNTHFL